MPNTMIPVIQQRLKGDAESICFKCFHRKVCRAIDNQPCIECNQFTDANGVTVQGDKDTNVPSKWISVKDRLPEKDGQYLIFTTQYFTPDHIDEIDHKDGVEISGYYKGYGFLSTNGIHAKYWCCLPQPPKGE